MHLTMPMSYWLRARLALSMAALGSLIAALALVPAARPQAGSPDPLSAASSRQVLSGADVRVKPDPKKAKDAYKQGLRAEQEQNWEAAQDAYSDAVGWAPADREYLLRREVAKSHLVQAKVDLAERDAVSGRLKEARRELIAAAYLDPTNRVVRDRLTELTALEPDNASPAPQQTELAGEIHLQYQPGNKNFDFRGDTQ